MNKTICSACNGSGYYDHHGSPDCEVCSGTGLVKREPYPIPRNPNQITTTTKQVNTMNNQEFLNGAYEELDKILNPTKGEEEFSIGQLGSHLTKTTELIEVSLINNKHNENRVKIEANPNDPSTLLLSANLVRHYSWPIPKQEPYQRLALIVEMTIRMINIAKYLEPPTTT